MIKINKKLISITLVFALVILLSTISYAKPFTQAFKGALIQINDFFAKEQYEPYSKTIDFFVFAILFISVYMAGVKYAFKEVKKPEKAIAVVLGFTTSLLLVLGGYSITALLPFVNWLLYFLLFVLMWWLLKDMKSKLWRFVVALLLSILLIALFQLLFWGIGTEISCPDDAFPYISLLLAILLFIVLWLLLKDIKNGFGRFLLALLLTIVIVLVVLALLKGSSIETTCPGAQSVTSFFGDLTGSLKGVDIGSFTPSTPQFLRGLTLRDIPTPSPPSGLLKQIEPPKVKEKLEEERLTLGEPKKAAVQESALGKIFDVDSKRDDINFQNTYDEGVRLKGQVETKIGKKWYKLDKDGQLLEYEKDKKGKLLGDGKKVDPNKVLEEKQRIEQEKAKSVENLGLFFGVTREKDVANEVYESEVAKRGEKGIYIDSQKYYLAKKDDKLVLKRERALYNPAKWFGGDEVIDPEQKPEIKKTIDYERKKREQTQPSGAAVQPPVAGQPTVPPASPTSPKQAPSPSPPAGGIFDSGVSWVWLLALLGLGAGTFAFIPKTRRWAINKWKTRGKWKIEATIPKMIAKIDEVKESIAVHKRDLAELHEYRTRLIGAADKIAVLLENIAGITEEGKKRRGIFGRRKQGFAYLFEHPEAFGKMEEEVNELIRTEGKLIDRMRRLAKLEIDFLNRLRTWKHLLKRENIDAESKFQELDNSIMQVINGVKEFFRVAEQEIKTENDLKALLENRDELIKKRFRDFVRGEAWLRKLLERDGQIITRLIGERA